MKIIQPTSIICALVGTTLSTLTFPFQREGLFGNLISERQLQVGFSTFRFTPDARTPDTWIRLEDCPSTTSNERCCAQCSPVTGTPIGGAPVPSSYSLTENFPTEPSCHKTFCLTSVGPSAICGQAYADILAAEQLRGPPLIIESQVFVGAHEVKGCFPKESSGAVGFGVPIVTSLEAAACSQAGIPFVLNALNSRAGTMTFNRLDEIGVLIEVRNITDFSVLDTPYITVDCLDGSWNFRPGKVVLIGNSPDYFNATAPENILFDPNYLFNIVSEEFCKLFIRLIQRLAGPDFVIKRETKNCLTYYSWDVLGPRTPEITIWALDQSYAYREFRFQLKEITIQNSEGLEVYYSPFAYITTDCPGCACSSWDASKQWIFGSATSFRGLFSLPPISGNTPLYGIVLNY